MGIFRVTKIKVKQRKLHIKNKWFYRKMSREEEHQLLLASKDIRNQFLIGLLIAHKIPFPASLLDSHKSLEESMDEVCSLYNKHTTNKRMYIIENTSDDEYVIIEDVEEEVFLQPKKDDGTTLGESITVTKSDFDSIFDMFRTIRTPKKLLGEYNKLKLEVLTRMTTKTYIEMLVDHYKIITDICELKKYNQKRTDEIMRLSFSPLDYRLLLYQMNRSKFDNNLQAKDVGEMTVDYIKPLNESLYISRYTGRQKEKIISNFLNYGCAVTTLKVSIDIYLSDNKYIVYLKEDDDDDDNDPFRFYYLSKESKTKKYWEMDCRLDGFVSIFIKNVSNYLIQLFRTIYNDVFHDNVYRRDFQKSALIFDNDCEQLLQNLCTLCNYKDVSSLLRNTFQTNCAVIQTPLDSFALRSDDTLLKKELEKREKEVDYNLIEMLFDNITDDEVHELYMKNYFKQ